MVKVLCCGWSQPMARSVRAPASNLMCRPYCVKCRGHVIKGRVGNMDTHRKLRYKLRRLRSFVITQRFSNLWIILQKTINPEYLFIGSRKTRCIVKLCKDLQLIRSKSTNVAPTTMTRFECFKSLCIICLYINGKFTDRIAADK